MSIFLIFIHSTTCKMKTILVTVHLITSLCVLGTAVFSMSTYMKYFVGFDLGTSGARISVVASSSSSTNHKLREVHSASVGYASSYDDPTAWRSAVHQLLLNTPQSIRCNIAAICVSGTSASCLLADAITGNVLRKPKMYNYDIILKDPNSKVIIDTIQTFAPVHHTVSSPTSTLAKLLHYHSETSLTHNQKLMHQADFIAATFLAPSSDGILKPSFSDWHNALKLGYDVQQLKWPSWLVECLHHVNIPIDVLPSNIYSPGQVIGTIDSHVASMYSIPSNAVLTGGTTDSNAAFFAAAAPTLVTSSSITSGIAVTSLGSTLAIKLTSSKFIEDASRGVYSHRFPSCFAKASNSSLWLVGGASNVGCAILRQENYSNQDLEELSALINPIIDSPLEYYPLIRQGERFPLADSLKQPIMEPKPSRNDRVEYLKAILQGIARVECLGYRVLEDLGSCSPNQVWTCGGGSRNDVWTQMRQRLLMQQFNQMNIDVLSQNRTICVERAQHSEASFGAAVLAASTCIQNSKKSITSME